jgi:hypothetical protein
MLRKLRDLYLRLGCARYEVYCDKKDLNKIVELAYFPSGAALDLFESNQSAEKSSVFSSFCTQLSLSAADVEISTLTQISLDNNIEEEVAR